MSDNIDILIGKFLSGNATSSESEKLKEWIAADEENEKQFDAFKRSWDLSLKLKREPNIDVEYAWQDFTERAKIAPQRNSPYKLQYVRAAAGLALIAFLSVIVGLFMSDTSEEKPQLISMQKPAEQVIATPEVVRIDSNTSTLPVVVQTPSKPARTRRKAVHESRVAMITLMTGDSARAFLLPDNTVVYLNEHSSLVYPENFNINNRKVSLDGEAYFEIEKDTMQFIVACHNTITRLREGAFNVRGFSDKTEVEVIIVSGKAEFSGVGKREYKKLILKEGERGTFDNNSSLVKGKNHRKDFKWWQKKNLRAKLKRIIENIKQKFNIKVNKDDATGASQDETTLTNR